MSGIGAVFYRDYRQRITNWAFMFWDIFVPIAYLTLFGTGFDRSIAQAFSIGGISVDYASFLLPGIIAMTAFSVAMNSSWSFFMDKDSGIFYEVLTYPITRRQFLVGRVCFSVVQSAAGSILAVVVGVLFMGIKIRWDLWPLTILAMVASTACWFFFLSIFAVRLRRMDSFNTLTSAAYIILMFLSSMFYPLSDVPAWFRWVARLNPMTWQVDLLRFSLLGAGSPGLLIVETVAFAAFILLCLSFAVRELERAA